jgi:hypothetical protein
MLPLIRRRTSLSLFAASLCLALAGPAAAEGEVAGGLYRWQTDDGNYAYTDSLKRVPERFQAKAERVELANLSDYKAYTPTDSEAAKSHAAQVAERLAYLRALNADLDRQEMFRAQAAAAPARSGGPSDAGSLVRVGPDSAPIYVPIDGGSVHDDEPVVVEEKRYRVEGSFVTRHDTIVRKGDRIIAVYKPRPHVIGLSQPSDIRDERELDPR